MSLKSARNALTAELKHYSKGLAYYQSKIQVLQETIERIDEIGKDQKQHLPSRTSRKELEVEQRNTKDGTKAVGSSANKRRQKRGTGQKRGTEMPATGQDFWLSLLRENEALTPTQIRNEALRALAKQGFMPDKVQLKKLNARMSNALSILATQRGRIVAEPSSKGRAKLYRRAVAH